MESESAVAMMDCSRSLVREMFFRFDESKASSVFRLKC
jgi:hypothetical protein